MRDSLRDYRIETAIPRDLATRIAKLSADSYDAWVREEQGRGEERRGEREERRGKERKRRGEQWRETRVKRRGENI